MIFLDTDIISYFLNANVAIKEKILEIIDRDEYICTTVINIYEILKGLRWKNNRKKENMFKFFLEDVMIFTVDNDVINIASDMYARLRKAGRTVGDADILIAAVVMKNKGILISNNIKHYEDIDGLRLGNWL
jgi:predicted nucleic acid-binding protein